MPAALINEPIEYYTFASDAQLEIGAGGCAQGDLLGPGTSGVGIVISADGVAYGARAQCAAASGDIIPVEIMIGQRGA